MRTLLSLALSIALTPIAHAQTVTPPAPPGGVEPQVAAPPGASVPNVPSTAPLTPVAPVPAAAPSAPAPVAAETPTNPTQVDAQTPESPAPQAPPAKATGDQAAPALAPLPPHSSLAKRPVQATALASKFDESPAKPYVRRSAAAPLAIAVGGGLTWNNDEAYGLAGNERQPQFDALVSYDVLQLTKSLVVSLGASARHSKASGIDLTIKDDSLQGELIARLATPSWLWPHARASVGAAWTRVSIDGSGLGGDLEARDVGLTSSFGGGLSLRTPTRALESASGQLASLSLGVLVEAGYILAKAAHLSATPQGASDDIERGAVRLGSVTRNAPYLRIMAIARF